MRPMKKFAYRALAVLILLVILTAVVYVQVNKFIFSHRVKAGSRESASPVLSILSPIILIKYNLQNKVEPS